ncbi:hypothetical protein CDAR_123741 [Caerostris darwini]|uniref:Uncharacterized protein n=1 Tax=Caerostris darwini TaxID=1538125 RepID=A0AAV4NCG2_9ARAC|nr:hypothetical protein CDAR_123741 [Caerostris darwini]
MAFIFTSFSLARLKQRLEAVDSLLFLISEPANFHSTFRVVRTQSEVKAEARAMGVENPPFRIFTRRSASTVTGSFVITMSKHYLCSVFPFPLLV